MGLFGSKKTYVSSTVYNLAGDEAQRPDYLKSQIVGGILTNPNWSAAGMIRDGYINGPIGTLRGFFRWAQKNYQMIGVPEGNLGGTVGVDLTIVASQIPHGPDEEVMLQSADLGSAEYSYWAEQWMMNNHPDLLDTDWTSDFDEETGDVIVQLPDQSTYGFTPAGFNQAKQYIYAAYNLTGGASNEPVVDGETQTLAAGEEFPSTAGWTRTGGLDGFEGTDGRQTNTKIYERTDFAGQNEDEDDLYSLRQIMTQKETIDLSVDPYVVVERTVKIDTQRRIRTSWGPAKMFIYAIGSGNETLDNLLRDNGTLPGEYLPFIPLRLDNKFLSETYQPEAYALVKKAYKKATGGRKFDDLIESVGDHEKIGDMDYIYMMYGVPLNVHDRTAREYLYRYFDRLRTSQSGNGTAFTAWNQKLAAYEAQLQTWTDWKTAQSDPTSPLYGTATPDYPVLPDRPASYVEIKSNGSLPTGVNMRISWSNIVRTVGTGLKKPGVKRGDLWINVEPNPPQAARTIYNKGQTITSDRIPNTTFSINWQVTATSWRTLMVYGAVHENLIYNGKSVLIDAKSAIEDGAESGFLVPLHYPTIREMSLIRSTQMMTAATFLVINTYLVKKTGFFGSLFFKIFVFVAIIAVSVATGGIGAGSVGLLGTAGSVGAAVGLTGIAAVLAGAIINAVVAAVVMKLVQVGSTAIFGEKLGAIIGSVLSVAAIAMGTSIMGGSSLSAAWGNLMNVQNIMAMTNAAGNGVAGYLQASAMGTIADMQKFQKDAASEAKRLTGMYLDEFGGPLDMNSIIQDRAMVTTESMDSFLSRTLLTGSDIAEMSMDMIGNFTDYTLSTELK